MPSSGGKSVSNLDLPGAPPQTQVAFADIYDKLDRIAGITVNTTPISTFTRLPLNDTAPATQRAVSDIYDKLQAITTLRATGGLVKAGVFTRLPVTNAPPSVQRAVSDIYDKLAVLLTAK